MFGVIAFLALIALVLFGVWYFRQHRKYSDSVSDGDDLDPPSSAEDSSTPGQPSMQFTNEAYDDGTDGEASSKASHDTQSVSSRGSRSVSQSSSNQVARDDTYEEPVSPTAYDEAYTMLHQPGDADTKDGNHGYLEDSYEMPGDVVTSDSHAAEGDVHVHLAGDNGDLEVEDKQSLAPSSGGVSESSYASVVLTDDDEADC